ncbi:MAG: hypothetical protein GC199_02575 [Alphaproteobacteria bacterium]|nr:hypothetical protein [Alphaproteobacteria bacterium]
MKARTFFSLAAGLGLLGAVATADAASTETVNPFAELSTGSDQPIHIAADSTLADFNEQTATYSGNVVVTQGEMRLRANELKIFAPRGRIARIVASGDVVLTSPSGSAKSPTAVYDVVPRTVVLSGGVILQHENNVMRGSELEVKLASGQARLIAPDGANGKPGRVQGLFAPAAKPQKPVAPGG